MSTETDSTALLLSHTLQHVPLSFFFFNDTATTEIYTLSLHDALPISTRMAIAFVGARDLPRRRSAVRGSQPKDRKSTRLNSSHTVISYAVFCLKKKKDSGNSAYPHQKLVVARLHAGRRPWRS